MDIQPKPSTLALLPEWLNWMIMAAVSLLGGLASFYQKMKTGHVRVWNLTELVGELTISGFAGIVAYNLCQWRELNPNLTIAIVGIVSHMGTKAIMRFEKWLTARYPLPAATPPSEGQ